MQGRCQKVGQQLIHRENNMLRKTYHRNSSRIVLHNFAQFDIFSRNHTSRNVICKEPSVSTNLDPLRHAIQQTGLTADIQSPLAVSARLVPIIFNTLKNSDPKAAQQLTKALYELAEPDECDLLLEGRSFTYLNRTTTRRLPRQHPTNLPAHLDGLLAI